CHVQEHQHIAPRIAHDGASADRNVEGLTATWPPARRIAATASSAEATNRTAVLLRRRAGDGRSHLHNRFTGNIIEDQPLAVISARLTIGGSVVIHGGGVCA